MPRFDSLNRPVYPIALMLVITLCVRSSQMPFAGIRAGGVRVM
jgi:hypothetical protein